MPQRINKKTMTILALLFTIIVLAGVAIVLLTDNKDATITIDSSKSIGMLYCSNDTIDDAFFNTEDEDSFLHEIKLTFNDEKPEKISYTHTGYFKDESTAKQQSTKFATKFDLYMGDHGFAPDSLNISRSTIDNMAKVNLLEEINKLNSTSAGMFFLDLKETGRDLTNKTSKALQTYYTNKNFKCEYTK